ncbi:MAG TPA: cell division ATP-binding protein FtsE [Candidatus Acidoferrales bacterium]|nr:cell division ATP-binding protein FtsE [Candidatus Acidoferrales bacterium]
MVHLFHVSKRYPPDHYALADISLRVEKGEFVFLSGPSGAGKTTLLKLLFGAERATSGQVIVNGRNVTRLNPRGIARLRQRLGLVFQDFKSLSHLTVLENVALAAEVAGVPRRESLKRAFRLLLELGLKDKHQLTPAALSGGEQQRMAIARALVNEPVLVLADEPTGNLDDELAGQTLRLFLNVHRRGATVIIATHDAGLLRRFPQRVVALQHGRLVGDSRPGVEEFAF